MQARWAHHSFPIFAPGPYPFGPLVSTRWRRGGGLLRRSTQQIVAKLLLARGMFA